MEGVMKRTSMILVVLTAIGLGSFVGVAAYTAPRMLVNIGFSFYVNDKQLPAGQYWVEMPNLGSGSATGSLLVFRSVDGSAYQMLLAKASGNRVGDQDAYLLFRRVGESYFLSKVHHGLIDSSVFKSRSEKDLKLAYARDWYGDSSDFVKVAATR
jgi:hypothetical protein